jgi:hypothetical protein
MIGSAFKACGEMQYLLSGPSPSADWQAPRASLRRPAAAVHTLNNVLGNDN